MRGSARRSTRAQQFGCNDNPASNMKKVTSTKIAHLLQKIIILVGRHLYDHLSFDIFRASGDSSIVHCEGGAGTTQRPIGFEGKLDANRWLRSEVWGTSNPALFIVDEALLLSESEKHRSPMSQVVLILVGLIGSGKVCVLGWDSVLCFPFSPPRIVDFCPGTRTTFTCLVPPMQPG